MSILSFNGPAAFDHTSLVAHDVDHMSCLEI